MNAALLNLLHLADPALPIGAFAHSAGLETYVQQQAVTDTDSAERFVRGMLSRSLQYTDAAFVSLAYSAAMENDISAIISLDAECSAVKLPSENRMASQKLGLRMLKIFTGLYPESAADSYKTLVDSGEVKGHYCIAYGLYAAAMQISKEDALTGFYYNAAAGMITNCVKLIPLGQQEGLKLLISVKPLILQLARQSLDPDKDLLGLCCPGFDIRSMQHEHLYSRLYMS